MSMNLDYHELHSSESSGSYGAFGLKILAAVHPAHEKGTPEPEIDLNHETIRHAVYDAEKLLQGAIWRVQIAKMPMAQARAKAQREQLIGFFPAPLFVEEIPNGYCSDYCCAHLPWFIVTTTLGRIKLGWRKSVINIDWSETKGTKTSQELFPNEPVTKSERGIHAWDYGKGKDYVEAILRGVPLVSNP